jgi:hypothetical protein
VPAKPNTDATSRIAITATRLADRATATATAARTRHRTATRDRHRRLADRRALADNIFCPSSFNSLDNYSCRM